LLVAVGLFATGSGINRPPTLGMISLNSAADEQGSSLGVAQSAGSLARIIAPLFATAVYGFQESLPYVISGFLAFLAALIAWQYLCRGRQAQAFTKSAEHVGGAAK
jgi:hypothetical protein